jgi:hypothetical protein
MPHSLANRGIVPLSVALLLVGCGPNQYLNQISSNRSAIASPDPSLATFVNPTDGASDIDGTEPFTWTSVSGVTAYYLYVGTSVGAKDLVDSGELQITSFSVGNLPAQQQLFGRIYTELNGTWRYSDISFTAAAVAKATLTSPVDGQTGVDATDAFTWSAIADAQAYYLAVGTAPGAKDVIDSHELHTTSYATSGLPPNQLLFARLSTEIGGQWYYTDSTFNTGPLPQAVFLHPTDGSTNVDTTTQPIQWTSVANAQAYYLYIGTTTGGKDLINSGELHTTNLAIAALPANQTLHARVYTEINNRWFYSDSTFISGMPPQATLTYPTDHSTNADTTSLPIQWTTAGGAQAYYLYIGTAPGAKDIVNTGELHTTSYFAPGLPTNQVLYATILTEFNNRWYASSTTFSSGAPPQAMLIAPLDGATNVDTTQPFQWTSVANAQAYYLDIGTTRGAGDLVNSGELHSTSYVVGSLPAGQTLFARLYTKLNGRWLFSDTSFAAAVIPRSTFIYPTDGSTSVDYVQPFRWSAVAGAQAYYLYVGTTPGGRDLVNSGELATTSYLVTNSFPTGQTLYARISTEVNGYWLSSDITFTAGSEQATFIYPSDGSTGVDWTQQFRWTPVSGAQAYYLYVGTTLGGRDLVNSGELSQTSYSIAGALPASNTLYARILTKLSGRWFSSDITFSAGTPQATFIYPADHATNVDWTQPFTWTAVSGAAAYYLYIGTTLGGHDVVNSGEISTTSYAIAGALPAQIPLYGRILTELNGRWIYSDVTFTAGTPQSTFVYPLAGSLNVDTTNAFSWTAISGAQAYYLTIGTSLGAKDIINSGEIQTTTRSVTGLPVGTTLYARISTLLNGRWLYSDITFTAAAVPRAVMLIPPDGATNVDVNAPFDWTPVSSADAYYLYIGTQPGMHDVYSSGQRTSTHWFVRNLMPSSQYYIQLWTLHNKSWTSSSSRFGTGATPPTFANRLAAAKALVDKVRTMADVANVPIAGTPLASVAQQNGHTTAFCTDYAVQLLVEISKVNIGPSHKVDVCFNDNSYDCHTLVEVLDTDQNEWILLDPTFDLVVHRASTGLYATADDISAAARATFFGDLAFEFLGVAGSTYAKNYYIDYPLLFLNVSHAGQGFPSNHPSVLPYLTSTASPVISEPGSYVASEPNGGPATLQVDMSNLTLATTSIDNVTFVFVGSNVTLLDQTSALYRLNRYLF